MFNTLIEHETEGTLKGLTLEWGCPHCGGLNFKILQKEQRILGIFHTRCRYCRSKYRVGYPQPNSVIEGEEEFMDMLAEEKFSRDERVEFLRDFAEIEYLKAEKGIPGVIREKQKSLEQKIALAKKRMR
jgi:transcription elongation factor Elf1